MAGTQYTSVILDIELEVWILYKVSSKGLA